MRYLGIDIGGTAVKIGIISEKGEVLKKGSYDVAFDDYETPILDTVLKSIDIFLDVNVENIENIKAIGVSATGQIDVKKGLVAGGGGHIKNWVGSPIKAALEEKYKKEVSVMNDADCVAIAEHWIGRAKGYNNVIVITVGTGIGGGIIENSKVLSGAIGIAGEVGHFTINNKGIPCPCGNRGCYEQYASMTALIRRVKEAVKYNKNIEGQEINGKTIFERVKSGDNIVCEVVDDWIDDISDGLVSLTHIFNPEIILIGGGVSVQEELFISKVRGRVLARVMPRFAESLVIESTSLGNDSGMVGAIKAVL